MPILAIDTATMVSSVAVADAGKLLAELTVQTRLTHSETLLPHVQQVLEMANTKKQDLEAVAVSMGPGSFTGLRIGLATAKAIAYGLNIPIIGVPTMEALAWHYPVPGVAVVPFIDAQKNNVYTNIYTWEKGEPKAQGDIQVMTIDDAVLFCSQQDMPVMAVGDIAAKKLKARENLPVNLYIGPQHLVMPRAANVAMAGLKRLEKEMVDSVMDLEPVYIRRSAAEEMLAKKQAEAAKAKES
ncbi:MAG: tRNA (adenosine(37)-N6)-threonylcarbamoyltransferase complex dimerization subunit type 1 TsaB [Anaerovibrio sp.]|nr:tRNA (adenosine(37)-N6)-threonylcarbamoyltransferase complex dimerization subunit type 1 TsaB [Selenomonadaceae bacterium]MDD6397621.1 tRNA (adenosine(37)-N6)-threonylcarbamoyltransferase complex dimerization subunit type 1 TsaB [Selenomonadaceae bacterium]MDY6053939.1 tRNA (adenosine(37)-N6)-threonylcarbamoyltransferase complex dimerization subunit type 1 TsaB [Anaerovibrio sp.]